MPCFTQQGFFMSAGFASKIMNHLPDSGLQQDKSGIGIPIDRVIEFPNHNLWY